MVLMLDDVLGRHSAESHGLSSRASKLAKIERAQGFWTECHLFRHYLLSKEGVAMKNLMRWDPFGIARRWDPFEELRNMQTEMERVFDRLLGTRGEGVHESVSWMPMIESYVKDGKLAVKAELPGVDAKDLDVSINDRELVIKGERRSEKDEKEKEYTYREISYGSFERHFLLPEGAKTDDLKARFVNGILEIDVPVPELPKAKKVQIETKDAKQVTETTIKKAA